MISLLASYLSIYLSICDNLKKTSVHKTKWKSEFGSNEPSFWWTHRRSLTRSALSLQVTESGSDVGSSRSLAIGLHHKYMGRLRGRGDKWISLRDSAELNGNLFYVVFFCVNILFSKASSFLIYAAPKLVKSTYVWAGAAKPCAAVLWLSSRELLTILCVNATS